MIGNAMAALHRSAEDRIRSRGRFGVVLSGALLFGAFSAGTLLTETGARAQTKIRVGKAQAQTFAFIPADVGTETGLFKRRGLDVEIASFAGDARLLQALAADALDIALGGGPTLAFVAKGAPMLAVAALADAPGSIMVVVRRDGPVKTEDDLKGRTLSVSSAGSLTYWLAQQLSRSHGWGADGIRIATLGSSAAQAAALKTNQIDGIVTETSTVFKLEEDGVGRILVRFGDRLKDFHVHVIYASRKLMESHPEAVRAFLAGWFDSVQYMRQHKEQTIDMAARVSDVSKAVAGRNYDELMPIFNPTGRFNPKALDVLSRSFVELGLLPDAPDMSKLYTEAFLPK
ncbi:MAG TPA: ABC transporter substrate-binding protein [Xanthobacteraceae bacterium]|nr:ABC transporter substrate-binding protein [Xanthobacteraceae bacterium]